MLLGAKIVKKDPTKPLLGGVAKVAKVAILRSSSR